MHKEDLSGINIESSVKKVRHQDLKRVGDSIYRSQCPEYVSGVLLVVRGQKNFQLLKEDMCILCGQKFIYSDFNEIVHEKGFDFKVNV